MYLFIFKTKWNQARLKESARSIVIESHDPTSTSKEETTSIFPEKHFGQLKRDNNQPINPGLLPRSFYLGDHEIILKIVSCFPTKTSRALLSMLSPIVPTVPSIIAIIT